MIAITVFIATYFGVLPSARSLIGVVAFLFAYSSIYYYNDLLDYSRDRQQGFMPRDKLLYHGAASHSDYIHLLAWSSILGISAAFLYSPALGVVTALTLAVAYLRTSISDLTVREVLLGVVELLNFEAFWIAMYGRPIPGLALPVFVTYSALYALLHALYKLRTKPLLWAVRQRWIQMLVAIVLVAAVFSIPLAASSVIHLLALLAASTLYLLLVGVQAMRYAHNVEGGMARIMKYHDAAILVTAVALMILGAWIVYAHLPSIPLPLSPPHSMVQLLSRVDDYQTHALQLAQRF